MLQEENRPEDSVSMNYVCNKKGYDNTAILLVQKKKDGISFRFQASVVQDSCFGSQEAITAAACVLHTKAAAQAHASLQWLWWRLERKAYAQLKVQVIVPRAILSVAPPLILVTILLIFAEGDGGDL